MNTIRWAVLLGAVQIVVGCASGKAPTGSVESVSLPEPALSTSGKIEPVAQRVDEDKDRDGIADIGDRCLDTTSGALVDSSGCEIVTGVIEGLKFEPNESDLSVESRLILSKMVDALLRYPDTMITVEGHTDNRGSAADNLELSKQRVLSVVRYMVSQGMSPDRIKPFGYGESRPRAANATAEGREQNRRIEINMVEGLL
ncbi:OmpA family protein [Granulosicoccus sp. 3-233]|uniref:OmpA family protein n=1 Tax=Granulosicoccus sp. 3-233 TaxID=3417969 RepID=UPI003D3516D1